MKKYLNSHNAACEIYKPLPLHQKECFKDIGYKKGDFPEAERAASDSLALPVANEVTTEQQEYVIKKIREFISA